MNKLYILLLLSFCSCQLQAQNTTISPTVFNPPSLSYEAIMTLPSPAKGSVVFDSTFNVLRIYNGTKWVYPLTAGLQQPLGMLAWSAGSGDTQSSGVATDAAGNVYITGFFIGSTVFDTTTITSVGGYDIFIAKYNGFGKLQWVQRAGGTDDDFSNAIAVDAAGNVYITGFFSGIASFGSINISSSNVDVFVAKYNSSGQTWTWAQRAGGTSLAQGSGIAVDNAGNVYISGSFTGTSNFGSTALTATNYDIFVAKCNSSGVFQWAQKAGGSSIDLCYSVAVDSNGNTCITGYFQGTATFNTTNLTSVGDLDIFIAKYSTNGVLQWVQQAGGTGSDSGRDVAFDAAGNVYATGGFAGTVTFGATNITSAGSTDFFITKYNTNGTLQWVKKAGGTSNDFSRSIAVDAKGYVYVTGEFTGTAFFDSISLTTTSSGQNDAFIAKFNSDTGTFQWAQRAGGNLYEFSVGVATDMLSNIYITGMYLTTATFGSTVLTSPGGTSVFVARVVE